MATNDTRSMNHELRLGMLDGSVKQINPDRGGEVEQTTADARQGLGAFYEMAEGRNMTALPVPDFMKIRT